MKTRFKGNFAAIACLLVTAVPTFTETARADCVSPPPGLIAWWRAENNALDQVGTIQGTLLNGAGFAPGLIGHAFSFNASSNAGVLVASTPELNPVNAITIEAWVKPFSFPNTGPTIVRKDWNATGATQYSLMVGDGITTGTVHMNIAAFLGGTSVSGGSVPTNVWTHVAGTYDRQFIRIYVNGIEVGNVPGTAAIPASTQKLAIGKEELFTDRDFDGLMDEVAIYNRALTAGEIQAIFNAGSAGKCSAPTLNIAALPGAVRLTWTTNATGYLLETNSALTLPAGWGVLTSNYNILNTNFAVTNAMGGATRFYRLHKP